MFGGSNNIGRASGTTGAVSRINDYGSPNTGLASNLINTGQANLVNGNRGDTGTFLNFMPNNNGGFRKPMVSVGGGIAENIADNSINNAYNLARGGQDYDIRTFRGAINFDPRLLNQNVYANGVPYYGVPNLDFYRSHLPPYSMAYPYGYPYNVQPGPHSYTSVDPIENPKLIQEYYDQFPQQYDPQMYAQVYRPPYNGPGCAPYNGCAGYPNPNDCRRCVSARGGGSFCADRTCGPRLPY